MIYKAIQELWMLRKTIDAVTVADQLTKNNEIDPV
jgi:replicative DNA helicase